MRRCLLVCFVLALSACVGAPTRSAEAAAATPSAPAALAAEGAAPRDPDKWEADIRAFEAEDARVRRRPGGVVFVGSSSIRYWTSLDQDFPGVASINRGFGGSRVYDSLRYAERIVLPYRPRAVVFYAGDNDLSEGRSPQQVRDDFAAFAQRVRQAEPQARIGFVSIKPSPSRAALLPQVRAANALVRDYAERADGVDYLDVYTPMLDGEGAPRETLFLQDRLHMNGDGYAIWKHVVGAWLGAL
ncbi:hypothetical protein K4L06_19240 [Lysobacter sp. BMK333-48F3]|uniref:SGNH/GDSL hydrolase family protein n=1 Tax=Lysobacter sp. BMK333-48F3 TaxID=2867962 RepID=UPI001C8BB0EE|nr:SGNH/GDSL hydrolase family protein [Lysobacter sp. BMK333-48F3]MBX9403453.1 hypothetical protein [Lysobacter sp. BMK333-48F3]